MAADCTPPDPVDVTSSFPGLDHAGLEVLSRQECLDLLSSAIVGRIAFVEDHEPFVFPVNIGVWQGAVVFTTGGGSKLDAALTLRAVVVEADDWDVDTHMGWSVVARGLATKVTDGREIASLDRLSVRSWVRPDAPKHWVSVRITSVTGRRTPPGPAGPNTAPAGPNTAPAGPRP